MEQILEYQKLLKSFELHPEEPRKMERVARDREERVL